MPNYINARCASASGSTTERTCNLLGFPAPGVYFIALYAEADYSGVDLTASYSAALTESVPVFNVSAPEGGSLNYTILVPAGTRMLSFDLSNGSGDANVYVRREAPATPSEFDCASMRTGNIESCTFSNPGSGRWHVTVFGSSSFSGARLIVSHNDGSANYGLTLRKLGDGRGQIRNGPRSILCEAAASTCGYVVASGTTVVLTATPVAGHHFAGWSGCTRVVESSCVVAMNHAYTVSATFTASEPTARLRFDAANGPTQNTIRRGSGAPVTFAWATSGLPSDASCRILRLPDDSYGALAIPVTGGTKVDNLIHNWAAGVKFFYLACSNGTVSPDIELVIEP